MVKQLSSIRDIRPTAWQSTSRDLCARPSLQATRSHLSKVVRVCRAWLPRVARGLRALPRRRGGRRRAPHRPRPPPAGTGQPRQRHGTGGRQSRTAFPIQNVPIPQTTGIRSQSSAGQRSSRSRSTFPIKARAAQAAPRPAPPDTHKPQPRAKGRLPNRPFTTEPPSSVNIHRNRAC